MTVLGRIEISKGSCNKYEWDEDLQALVLDRVLPSGSYPVDYGFIPNTLGRDGDPLDILLCCTEPTIPGCLVPLRIVGMLEMIDGGEGDDKLICVPTKDARYDHVQELADLPEGLLREIAQFFATYKALDDKTVEVGAWKSRDHALSLLEDSAIK